MHHWLECHQNHWLNWFKSWLVCHCLGVWLDCVQQRRQDWSVVFIIINIKEIFMPQPKDTSPLLGWLTAKEFLTVLNLLSNMTWDCGEMWPISMFNSKGTREGCRWENPRKRQRRAQGFHLGIFFPSWSKVSSTYTRHLKTWAWQISLSICRTRDQSSLCEMPEVKFGNKLKPKQCTQLFEATILYELLQANEWPIGACVGAHPLHYCLYVAFSNLILMLGTPPPPWMKLLLLPFTMSLEVGSSNNPVIQMVCLDLEPFILCHWFKSLGTFMVSLALLEYWGKLTILPLAWSTKKLPHAYPTHSLPNVWGRQPQTGEKWWSAETQSPE